MCRQAYTRTRHIENENTKGAIMALLNKGMKRLDQSSRHPLMMHPETQTCPGRASNPGPDR
jgi:hypothetical protein